VWFLDCDYLLKWYLFTLIIPIKNKLLVFQIDAKKTKKLALCFVKVLETLSLS